MIARIRNFTVGLCRGKQEGPVRTMELNVECAPEPNLHRVFIHFYEKKTPRLGFTNGVTNSVVCFLPVQDFDLTRDLLHAHTNDVFFAYVQDVEGELVWAEITTSAEAMHAAKHHGLDGIEVESARGG